MTASSNGLIGKLERSREKEKAVLPNYPMDGSWMAARQLPTICVY